MEPFLGQIEAFPYSFAPKGWVFCAGQILPISQNQALFSLLGTTFGGNGTTNFALPDLRGREGIGAGTGPGLTPRTLGGTGGEETHTLAVSEVPPHTHALNAVVNGTAGGTDVPGPSVVLASGYSSEPGAPVVNVYGSGGTPVAMGALAPTGGQPHENRGPYLAVNYCIALQGVFPPHP